MGDGEDGPTGRTACVLPRRTRPPVCLGQLTGNPFGARMATSSCAVFERWAYGIGRLHHGHHGRMDVQRGSSVRSGGIVLTMSSCLASSTFVICSNRIKNITTRPARTYHCRRTRRSPAPSGPSVKRWPCQFWAGCTINISEREFPIGTEGKRYQNIGRIKLFFRKDRSARQLRCNTTRYADHHTAEAISLGRSGELSLFFLRKNHVPVIPISFRNWFLALAPIIVGG